MRTNCETEPQHGSRGERWQCHALRFTFFVYYLFQFLVLTQRTDAILFPSTTGDVANTAAAAAAAATTTTKMMRMKFEENELNGKIRYRQPPLSHHSTFTHQRRHQLDVVLQNISFLYIFVFCMLWLPLWPPPSPHFVSFLLCLL